MNEDERGITPPDVTSMTIDRPGRDWQVIIEQGNGNVIKVIELTDMEHRQLGLMLETSRLSPVLHVSFVDVTR